ncbi:MAG: SH3b protein [Candidatus Levybacteria bacterium]|nr:SH3b protein [Candidatus Levybacteria bacterium]
MFVAPLLIAIAILFGILYFLGRQSGKGALRVTAIPKSSIYLENKLIGATPFCACDLEQMLSAGDYTIKLVPNAGNIRPYEAKFTINKGTLTAVDRAFADNGSGEGSIISLSPISDKKDIELLVISMPDKANVFLDSNPVGITPLLLKQVSDSDHNLRLTFDGYKEKSIKIKTSLGFRLNSLVFLGVNPDLSNPSISSGVATPSPSITVSKVLILDTPTGFLRVRENSSIASIEIAQIKPGESYELISEKEGWFEIKLSSSSGKIKTGWISFSYAAKK